MNVDKILADLEAKHPGEKEYLQAVREVLLTVQDEYDKHPEFEKAKIIERMVEPDRIFTFRVTWVDDKGEVQNNIGYRHSRTPSQHCLWVVARVVPTSAHAARAMLKSCVSAKLS